VNWGTSRRDVAPSFGHRFPDRRRQGARRGPLGRWRVGVVVLDILTGAGLLAGCGGAAVPVAPGSALYAACRAALSPRPGASVPTSDLGAMQFLNDSDGVAVTSGIL
jgi:hypothetical protein